MKTKSTLIALLFSTFAAIQISSQTNNYFGSSGTFSGNVWNTSDNTYSSALNTTGGAAIIFNNDASYIGTAITVASIAANANVTCSSSTGNIISFSAPTSIDVASGKLIDFGGQNFNGGFEKKGAGTMALSGNNYSGGFTLTAGTVVTKATNALGGTGLLTINGGTIGTSSSRTISSKTATIGGDFTLGSTISPSVGSANITFDNTNTFTLGAATRTITIGGTGNYTFDAVISGSASAGLTVNSAAAGVLILSGANTYPGVTTINSGTLKLANVSSLGTTGNGTVVNKGGVLDLNGLNYSSAEPLFLATGINGSITNTNASTATYSGPITLTDTAIISGASGLINLNSASSITGTAGVLYLGGASGGAVSSAINISGNVIKNGNGTWTLSGANGFTGTLTLAAGTLVLGAAEVIPNSSGVVLNGATLTTGSTTGFTEKVGTLDVKANSTIALGTGSHTLTFDDSHAVSWGASKTITITGWSGSNAGGTAGKIFFGTNASGLTSTQLSMISFSGYGAPAILLSSGELVPDVATKLNDEVMNDVTVTAKASTITVNGLTEKTLVSVYNSTGGFIKSVELNSTNNSFELTKKGICIIKVGVKVFKVIL